MKKNCSFILIIFAIIATTIAYFGFNFYRENYANNIKKEGFILIPHGSNFQNITDSIKKHIDNLETFKSIATKKNLPQKFHAGRYQLKKGMGNATIINMIKAGNQTEDTFRIIDFGDVYQMIGRVTKKTETDSATFIKQLNQIATQKGYNNAEDLKKYFFIDTYNFYWTVTPKQFFNKFEKQYNQFWNTERTKKEKISGLNRNQIYALASIVYKESGGKTDEMKTIAGLYLNRYKKGMKLKSDPTVIYAINKDSQFTTPIKRVFYKHLNHQSPYNTYKNEGIPPGPICIVDKNAVDAVLNPEKHNYLFMAADPHRIGFHRFTSSDTEHAKNAKEYQNWLDKKNIK